MERLIRAVEAWIEKARARQARGDLTAADLDRLGELVRAARSPARQRLLYLHAREPSVTSEVVGLRRCCHLLHQAV